MSFNTSNRISKVTAERSQRALLDLVTQPGNDVCADCKTRNPGWASHNLGIFICVKCAAIHRKIGTHISKVKSLRLDTWTKEQVDHMKEMGNIKSNAYFNPDEIRNRPPTNMIEQERDSDLEKYIRGKYEFKKFVDKSASVAVQLGLPVNRAHSMPVTPRSMSASSTAPSLQSMAGYTASSNQSRPRTGSVPAPASQVVSISDRQAQAQSPSIPGNTAWTDLLSLGVSSQGTSLPLQFASQPSQFTPQPSVPTPSSLSTEIQQPSFTNYFIPQAQSNPYMQQLSTTPEIQMLNAQQQQPQGFNPTMIIPPGPPMQQFGTGSLPFSSHSFQPSQFQQPQFQQPMLTSIYTQVPLNNTADPSFAHSRQQQQQQQLQPGILMSSTGFSPAGGFSPALSPFGQNPHMPFVQDNSFQGWQGQPGNFQTQHQPWSSL